MNVLREMRRDILRIACATQEGHIGASFSCLEILWTLYDRIMQRDPVGYDGLSDIERDRLVLSKGHAALGLYTVLAEKGFIAREDLLTFCAPGSRLEGHPNIAISGVEVSTGSLGHGLPMAVGIAMALRLEHTKSRVFCIVGDGECSEGSIWEAVILAAHLKLKNLFLIVDANNSSPVKFEIASRLHAFGFATRNCNGHKIDELIHAFRPAEFDAPTAVIAHTVKGYGCAPLEKAPELWHHRSPQSKDELETMISLCR